MPDSIALSNITAEFQQGLQKRDVALVEKALAGHVNPETQVRGMHPLHLLLATALKPGFEHLQTDFEQKTNAIIELLFAHGLKVTEPDKFNTGHYNVLIDHLVLADNTVSTAAIVLHAIDETVRSGKAAYQPDIKELATAQIEATYNEGVDPADLVESVVNKLERLHDTVRERLENPQNPLEKALVAEYADKITSWTQPFNRPHIQTLVPDILRGFQPGPSNAPRRGELSREFSGGAADLDRYIKQMPPKTGQQILAEMEKELVGFEDMKREAQQLAFRTAYDRARGAPEAARVYGECIMGGEGLGKSTFAHKKAELLIALGLAGPNVVEFNKENMAGPSVTLPPPALAAIFAKADVIVLELPEPVYGGHSDAAEFTPRLMTALQMSLAGRDDKPAIFLTGSAATLDEMLHLNPGIKAHINTFKRLDDMNDGTLKKVLAHKVEDEKLKIDDDATGIIMKALDAGRREHGKLFTHAREINAIVDKAIDALAERMGKNPPAPDAPADSFITITAADVKSLNLEAIIAGPNLARSRGMGFSAKL